MRDPKGRTSQELESFQSDVEPDLECESPFFWIDHKKSHLSFDLDSLWTMEKEPICISRQNKNKNGETKISSPLSVVNYYWKVGSHWLVYYSRRVRLGFFKLEQNIPTFTWSALAGDIFVIRQRNRRPGMKRTVHEQRMLENKRDLSQCFH